MSASSRRTVLALLGLAPASAAVGAESFVPPPDGKGLAPMAGPTTDVAIATALRNMADAIDRGEIVTTDISVDGSLRANEIMKHRLAVEFYYAV